MKRGLDRASAHGRGERRGGAPKGERVPLNARPARSAYGWQHPPAWRGPTGQSRLFGAPPPLIFWRQKLGGFGRQNSGAVRRENESACHLLGSAARDSFSPRAGRRMG